MLKTLPWHKVRYTSKQCNIVYSVDVIAQQLVFIHTRVVFGIGYTVTHKAIKNN